MEESILVCDSRPIRVMSIMKEEVTLKTLTAHVLDLVDAKGDGREQCCTMETKQHFVRSGQVRSMLLTFRLLW
jgi:hypothetical protein